MNKNSKVLALKYRPQVFEDLIGQDIVAETIINSKKFCGLYLRANTLEFLFIIKWGD